jgi:hypothetical protein
MLSFVLDLRVKSPIRCIFILSRWLLDIFKLGYRKDLEIKDLYDALQEHRSDFLGNKLEK